MTALAYYEKLVEEAEAERKAKKRNLVSGVYKLVLFQIKLTFVFIKEYKLTYGKI